MDKSTMLRLTRDGWAELSAFLAQCGEAQLKAAHPPDGWSIQDMLAHIAFWENYALLRLREAGRGEKPRLHGNITEADLNRINQEVLTAGRQQTLAEVRANSQRIHQELWVELEALPEAQNSAWWSLWPDAEAPCRLIQYNTSDHYAEHLADARKWLKL